MDDSRNDVVLIDDGSDIEMSVVENLGDSSKPNDDDLDFSVRVKRFLESCCVIDQINLDVDEKKFSSKCLNSFCSYGKELQVAPEFVKSHYGLVKSKNLQVCKLCYHESVKHFRGLASRIEKKESVFKTEFPKCSPIVLIDSDDEEEVLNKDEPLSNEQIEILPAHFDEHVKEFFKNHDISLQEKKADKILNRKLYKLERDLVTMRKDLISGEKELMRCMSNFYQAYLPMTEEVEQVDIPFEDLRITLTNNEPEPQGSSSENEVCITHERTTRISLKSPPPDNPEAIRPKLKAGDRVYVMKISECSEWVPARIEEVIQKSVEGGQVMNTYRVQIDNGKQSSYQKEVEGGCMAYWDPSEYKLPLGTRAIALSSVFPQTTKTFFPGITAEYCSFSQTMGYRYLVFFDDGHCLYVPHDEIRIVCEPKKDVAEYFRPESHEFIRRYLDTFPERPMLKVQLLEIIKTEYEGCWYNARVKDIDCALVQMLFLKDYRTEWIYRGSTRLYPLFVELNMRKEPRHRGLTFRKNRPVVHYSDGVGFNRDDCSDEIILSNQPRAVARKSSAKQWPVWDKKDPRHPSLPEFGHIETIIPDGPEPKSYAAHRCSSHCVAWTQFSPEQAKGLNPLSIPHRFGFRRFQMVGESEQDIIYKAPCGRLLREQDEVLTYLRLAKSELTVELFDFNFWVNIFDELMIPDRFIKIKDLSYGKEMVPISCVNTVDISVPNYMDYITERRGCEGVFLNLDSGFLTCCDCTDNCEDKMKCACWQKTITGFKALGKKNNIDPNTIGYQHRRLPELVSTGIYECNQMCKCKKTCLNRVVQHPLKLKLQLFKTKRKGWGTRCLNDIPCGTFICVYVGDILTEANANEGGKRYGDEYFAELDYIEVVESLKVDYEDEVIGLSPDEDFEETDLDETGRFSFGSRGDFPESDEEFEPDYGASRTSRANNSLCMQLRNRKNKSDNKADEIRMAAYEEPCIPRGPSKVSSSFGTTMMESFTEKERSAHPSVRSYYGKEESVYIMDAKTAGNIGRYLNHSCDPNIFVQNVFVDTHDLRFPWVAFFAMRYIKAGTELTWDYRYEVGSVPGKKMYCFCGSEECRGRLL